MRYALLLLLTMLHGSCQSLTAARDKAIINAVKTRMILNHPGVLRGDVTLRSTEMVSQKDVLMARRKMNAGAIELYTKMEKMSADKTSQDYQRYHDLYVFYKTRGDSIDNVLPLADAVHKDYIGATLHIPGEDINNWQEYYILDKDYNIIFSRTVREIMKR